MRTGAAAALAAAATAQGARPEGAASSPMLPAGEEGRAQARPPDPRLFLVRPPAAYGFCRDAEWGRSRTDWHTLTVDEAAARLRTDPDRGLAAAEAAARLLRHGPNAIAGPVRRPWWTMLAAQLRDFMVLVLIGAAAVSFLFRELADGAAILAIVAVNAVLGYLQEARAERSLEALRALTAPTARVVRDGRAGQAAAAGLVPGDLVLLEAGDRVPADLRLVGAADLAADEAPLTGESQAVEKMARPLVGEGAGAGLATGDRRNMAYQGTHVVRGRGRGLVVATGGETEVGRIAGLIGAAGDRETPLQRRLDQVGRILVLACLLISATVVLLGVLQGEDPYRMFLAGVSLAVAAIPEGLPAIVTIALALGVQRMIRKHAIVRRLPAVETLGCATVICTDKTGTLTQNAMRVRAIHPEAGEAWRWTLETAALCNDAAGEDGDPTEVALLRAAAEAGMDPAALRAARPRVAEVPFDSARRRMAVICAGGGGRHTAHVKGALDEILARCSHVAREGGVVPLDEPARRAIRAAGDAMAGRALRVLAMARRELPPGVGPLVAGEGQVAATAETDVPGAGGARGAGGAGGARSAGDVPRLGDAGNVPGAGDAGAGGGLVALTDRDLTFCGICGLLDPPRPEAREAIRRCREAGVRVVMITGDHALTACAVAGELGLLPPGGRAATGADLAGWSDRELAVEVERTFVYARTSPADKLRIVRALQAHGHVVAMTGDGVNDAPAVREADIGVAMGRTGTDVTKEASAMVLTDDNFATIVAAIEEGRAIYDNIRKFVRYLLACNTGEILVTLS